MDKKAVVIAGAGSTHTPGIIQSLLQKKNEGSVRPELTFCLNHLFEIAKLSTPCRV